MIDALRRKKPSRRCHPIFQRLLPYDARPGGHPRVLKETNPKAEDMRSRGERAWKEMEKR
jgi:hypothetical protein